MSEENKEINPMQMMEDLQTNIAETEKKLKEEIKHKNYAQEEGAKSQKVINDMHDMLDAIPNCPREVEDSSYCGKKTLTLQARFVFALQSLHGAKS